MALGYVFTCALHAQTPQRINFFLETAVWEQEWGHPFVSADWPSATSHWKEAIHSLASNFGLMKQRVGWIRFSLGNLEWTKWLSSRTEITRHEGVWINFIHGGTWRKTLWVTIAEVNEHTSLPAFLELGVTAFPVCLNPYITDFPFQLSNFNLLWIAWIKTWSKKQPMNRTFPKPVCPVLHIHFFSYRYTVPPSCPYSTHCGQQRGTNTD